MGLKMGRRFVIMIFDGLYVVMRDVIPATGGFMYGWE